jgi:peptidoglycan hydrolase-like protein with peptidoglycan-binding domain
MKSEPADAENVRWFQQKLKDAGYDIAVTGNNDAQSIAAIKDFQQAKGVQVTGTETLETVHALHDHIVQGLQGAVASGAGSGAAVNGALPVVAPVPTAAPLDRPQTVTVLPAGSGPDFGETAPQQPRPIVTSPFRPGDPVLAAMPPDTQKMLTDAAVQDSIAAHNQGVNLTRSLNAHVGAVRDAALDMTPGGQPQGPWDAYAENAGPWSNYQ